MKNTVKQGCRQQNCKIKYPVFNYYGESKGLYCSTHKLERMIDVKSPKCKQNDCNKRPTFNYNRESKGLYCSTHKLEEMINVKRPKCKHDGCNRCPSFNYKNKSKGLYCLNHKLEDMIDVNSPKCNKDTFPTPIPILSFLLSLPTHLSRVGIQKEWTETRGAMQ